MKTSAKTSKRRLKKSVRRTVGGVCMASAIMVAAIPFPDAVAYDPASTTLPVYSVSSADYETDIDFYVDNNIKGCPELEHYYEDSYFVRQAFALTTNVAHTDNPIWWWKYRIDSCVRTDYTWTLKTYPQKIRSNEMLVKALIDHNLFDHACNYVFVQMYEGYFTLLEDEIWNTDTYKQYKPAIEQKLKEYYLKYKDLFEKVNPKSAAVMMDVLRKRFYTEKGKISIESITFKDWLQNILLK